MRIVAEIDIQ